MFMSESACVQALLFNVLDLLSINKRFSDRVNSKTVVSRFTLEVWLGWTEDLPAGDFWLGLNSDVYRERHTWRDWYSSSFWDSSSLERTLPGLWQAVILLGWRWLGAWDRVRCSHSWQVSLWVYGEQEWQEYKKDKFESKFVKNQLLG